jgi:hypothetical protein
MAITIFGPGRFMAEPRICSLFRPKAAAQGRRHWRFDRPGGNGLQIV